MKNLTLFFLATQVIVTSQVPFMLKDVTPGSASSRIGDLYVRPTNEVLFFAAPQVTPSTGAIYRTDGSVSGTYKLSNVVSAGSFAELGTQSFFGVTASGHSLWKTNGQVAGTDSMNTPGLTDASELRTLGQKLAFTGKVNTTTFQIWGSDGTSVGTSSLAGPFFSIQTLTVVNNICFLAANTSSSGTELWRTDGTSLGTYQLKDIRVGAAGSFTGNPIKAVSNNKIYFIANDGTTGEELYVTDGTANGTTLLKDINPGTASSNAMAVYYPASNGVFFMADNNVNGIELWFTDGTSANTQLIRDAATGTLSAQPSILNFANGYAYYFYRNISGNGILYKSDGTSAGTSTISIITPGSNNPYISDDKPRIYNGYVYLICNKSFGTANEDSIYLHKVDLNLGTHVISDRIRFDQIKGGNFMWHNMTATQLGSKIIYYPHASSSNLSALIFNLATATHKIHYKLGGQSQYYPFPLVHQPVGNKFYFPFKTNANSPGYLDLTTDSIYNLYNSTYQCSLSDPNYTWDFQLYTLNNKAYFLSYETGYGLELFGTDYTPSGTSRLLDLNAGGGNFDNDNSQNLCISRKFKFFSTPNNLYFLADDITNGAELWALVSTSVSPQPSSLQETAGGRTIIFPNPSNGNFSIESDAPFNKVVITNVAGATIREYEVDSTKADLSCSDLSRGIYFVKIEGPSFHKTMKLVIE